MPRRSGLHLAHIVFAAMLCSSPGVAQTAAPAEPSYNRSDSASPANVPASADLSLLQAEGAALRNQPRIAAAQLRARAAQQRILESRSAFLPNLAFNATGVQVADTGTSTAAGFLTTSSLSDRFAYGGTLTQLVTDFGRSGALLASNRAAAAAQADAVTLSRAQIRLAVRQAFFGVLGAEAVLRAARDAQANRRLVTRQITALAGSQLRSTLDVHFASVLEAEADLAVVRAQSLVEQQRSRLAAAMGQGQAIANSLLDPPLPPPAPQTAADLAALTAEARQTRADLDAARLNQRSAEELAKAESRLHYPNLQVLGAAGQIPFHDHTLQDSYAAGGFNLNIPIFNGGLFRARAQAASLEAGARTKDVADLSLRVNQQVRDAQSQVVEAFRAIEVTGRLVTQSAEALRLAEARYNAGLGSIVELNQAQLNQTSAQINAADARYSYLARRADLDFAVGLLN